MNKYFIFFWVFISIQMHAAFAQDITTLIKADVVKMNLPYRDATMSFSLSFDSVQNEHSLHFNKSGLDKEVVKALERNWKRILNTLNDRQSYSGELYFDNYTNDVFVNLVNIDSKNEVFYALDAVLQPRDGMNRFISQWAHYLDSLNVAGRLETEEYKRGKTFSFYVERNGILTPDSIHSTDPLLKDFLKDQKRWSSGIMSGRPVAVMVDLRLPGSFYKGKDRQVKVENQDLVYIHSLLSGNDHTYVFYTFDLKSISPERFNIVSVIHDKGRYYSPVVHAGNIKEAAVLTDKLMSQKYSYPYYFYPAGAACRIYFYNERRDK
ncbi:hypothetical protein [Sphingobacterium spiritivorum]|nr:hypothetical protein [Sphingobacterium spiritivorum]QQS97177.1 hypothetical protein I6J03_05550 [Sphingobacterium spiritivorum]